RCFSPRARLGASRSGAAESSSRQIPVSLTVTFGNHPTSGAHAAKREFSRGIYPGYCLLNRRKCRCHRHQSRPLKVYWCGRMTPTMERTLADARVGGLEQLAEIVEHEVRALQLVDHVGPPHHRRGLEGQVLDVAFDRVPDLARRGENAGA